MALPSSSSKSLDRDSAVEVFSIAGRIFGAVDKILKDGKLAKGQNVAALNMALSQLGLVVMTKWKADQQVQTTQKVVTAVSGPGQMSSSTKKKKGGNKGGRPPPTPNPVKQTPQYKVLEEEHDKVNVRLASLGKTGNETLRESLREVRGDLESKMKNLRDQGKSRGPSIPSGSLAVSRSSSTAAPAEPMGMGRPKGSQVNMKGGIQFSPQGPNKGLFHGNY